jgi:hypothetical protein
MYERFHVSKTSNFAATLSLQHQNNDGEQILVLYNV